MTTPSNVLTDEDLALLRSLPSIGSTGAMSDRFTRDRVRKLMADQYVIGEDYLIWRSFHADVLLSTIDHHTQQARADERRRIDELAFGLQQFDARVNTDTDWWILDPVGCATAHDPSFIRALEAATTKEGTDQ